MTPTSFFGRSTRSARDETFGQWDFNAETRCASLAFTIYIYMRVVKDMARICSSLRVQTRPGRRHSVRVDVTLVCMSVCASWTLTQRPCRTEPSP